MFNFYLNALRHGTDTKALLCAARCPSITDEQYDFFIRIVRERSAVQ